VENYEVEDYRIAIIKCNFYLIHSHHLISYWNNVISLKIRTGIFLSDSSVHPAGPLHFLILGSIRCIWVGSLWLWFLFTVVSSDRPCLWPVTLFRVGKTGSRLLGQLEFCSREFELGLGERFRYSLRLELWHWTWETSVTILFLWCEQEKKRKTI
jgi:hypothetical protein